MLLGKGRGWIERERERGRDGWGEREKERERDEQVNSVVRQKTNLSGSKKNTVTLIFSNLCN
jgi:hypothetical protein